jgi:hypothetical protein
MLSESDLIDQVNPFVDEMPGAWSKPYGFASYMKLDDEPPLKEDPSPACEMATTAGDKQIDFCKPGEPNCPMSRELEPTQKADADISYEARDDVMFGTDLGVVDLVTSSAPTINTQFFINLALLLIFVIILIKLTERL